MDAKTIRWTTGLTIAVILLAAGIAGAAFGEATAPVDLPNESSTSSTGNATQADTEEDPESDGEEPNAYWEVHAMTDMIQCGVGTPAGGLECTDPDDDGLDFSVDAPAGTTVVVAELRWDASTPTGAKSFTLSGPAEISGAQTADTTGPSILRLDVPAPTSGVSATTPVPLRVELADEPHVVVDQVVEIRISVFVNMGAPNGYSAF